jgi:hypothetical protein
LKANQDFADGAPVQVGKAHAVVHKPAFFHKFWKRVYRWKLQNLARVWRGIQQILLLEKLFI